MRGARTRTSLPVLFVLSWSIENASGASDCSTAAVTVTHSPMYGSGFAASVLAASGTSGLGGVPGGGGCCGCCCCCCCGGCCCCGCGGCCCCCGCACCCCCCCCCCCALTDASAATIRPAAATVMTRFMRRLLLPTPRISPASSTDLINPPSVIRNPASC